MYEVNYKRSGALHAFKRTIIKLQIWDLSPSASMTLGCIPPLQLFGAEWSHTWKEEWILPYGVVHPGHCEECRKIRRVGGTHNEGEEPPAPHHNAHGHGVHWGFATYRRPAKWIGPGLLLSPASSHPCQKCSSSSTPPPGLGKHHWSWGGEQGSEFLASYRGWWQFWERFQRPPVFERDGRPPNTKNPELAF